MFSEKNAYAERCVKRERRFFWKTRLKNKEGAAFGLPYKSLGIWSITYLIGDVLAESGAVDPGSAIYDLGLRKPKQE